MGPPGEGVDALLADGAAAAAAVAGPTGSGKSTAARELRAAAAAVYGTVVLAGVTELAAHGAGPGTVEFTVEDMVHLDLGTICWLDDPLLPDAVHLTGLGYSFDQAAGTRVQATGRAPVGTAAVWPRPAP